MICGWCKTPGLSLDSHDRVLLEPHKRALPGGGSRACRGIEETVIYLDVPVIDTEDED